ncbi:hypothetical protein [Nocardia vaccinii]|uniref:hypothetical protein n=1 Tax=Nocardia vaccinii TaxID=1822 RepID=UPI00082EB467|nr:hypothetical protein [Nocardia vaccinii]
MLGELAGWIARDMITDRIDRHVEQREERKGKFGVPVVTSVAMMIGTVAAVGLFFVERRSDSSGGVPVWPIILVGVRAVLVVLIAFGLRAGRADRRGGWVYFGIMLTEAVNLFIVLVDGIAVIAAGLGHAVNVVVSIGGGSAADLVPARFVWALTAVGVVGFLADMVIAIALAIRRRALD